MRRGCRVLFVHFHSYPILSRASQEKARELARLLTRFQFHSRLFLVPFGEIQQQVVLAVPPPLRVVIYRRLMMRIAERIARQHRAQALVTGEVVGQVASQTLENLASIGSVVTLPVLRPLVGMDKEEITAEAQRLGTYPISIIPDQDCCTLFTPRHPGDQGATARRRARRGRRSPIDEIVERGRRRGRGGGLPIPGIPMIRITSVRSANRFEETDERENHTGQARRHEGGFGRARRDCRRRHGSARLAAEVARQGKGRQTSATARWRNSSRSSPKC